MNYDPDMMNRVVLGALGALVLAPAVAVAQPAAGGGYYGQPVVNETGHHLRGGMPMFGFSIGLGGLSVDEKDVDCATCDYQPIGLEVDAHIGGMLSHQFGLMLELQINAETVSDTRYETTTLSQSTVMVAGQYWVTPQLWVKGGLGLAHLAYEYDNYYYGATEPVDDGVAMMLGAGYELYSSPSFALDLQGRLITAGYDGIDRKVSALTVGVGFNWFGWGRTGGVLVIH